MGLQCWRGRSGFLFCELTNTGLRDAVQTCLAFVLYRCADKCASVVVWDNTRDMVTHVFGRQALPMVWDFAEANLLSDNGWNGALEWVLRVLENLTQSGLAAGTAAQASATAHPLPSDSGDAGHRSSCTMLRFLTRTYLILLFVA